MHVWAPCDPFFSKFCFSIFSNFFLIKRKLKSNFVFLEVLMAKIDRVVQIEYNWKLKGPNWEVSKKFGGYIKSSDSLGVESEVSFFFFAWRLQYGLALSRYIYKIYTWLKASSQIDCPFSATGHQLPTCNIDIQSKKTQKLSLIGYYP